MTCPICDGDGVFLGALGDLDHYSCRDCGMQFSVETPPDEGEEENW